jgi:DNA-binding transcriptional ArsR family regulator
MGTEVINFVKNKQLEEATSLLRALAHPLRLKLLNFIDKNPGINVNKIYKALKVEQSLTSQQLHILRTSRLVIAKRDGRFILYSLNYAKLEQIARTLDGFVES